MSIPPRYIPLFFFAIRVNSRDCPYRRRYSACAEVTHQHYPNIALSPRALTSKAVLVPIVISGGGGMRRRREFAHPLFNSSCVARCACSMATSVIAFAPASVFANAMRPCRRRPVSQSFFSSGHSPEK